MTIAEKSPMVASNAPLGLRVVINPLHLKY